MATDPILDPVVIVLWRFVRGDTPVVEFERWVYANVDELDTRLGALAAHDVVSADFRSMDDVARVRTMLRSYAERAAPLACGCVTMANVAVIDMGPESSDVIGPIVRRCSRGDQWWWLWCGECAKCGQWWLVAQEERQNDVFCLRRLDGTEVGSLLNGGVWPGDFDTYESLLELTRANGRAVSFADPEGAASLRWTISDLARARPGITVSELAGLLNLESDLARALALRAIRDDGVEIDVDPE